MTFDEVPPRLTEPAPEGNGSTIDPQKNARAECLTHDGIPEEYQTSIEYRSPLWIITQHPILNDLVRYLDVMREKILTDTERHHTLTFSRRRMAEVRASFSEMIRQGEERLHRFAELLCNEFFPHVNLHSVVIGEVPSTHERFTLIQSLSRKDLYSSTDLDLGTRQLHKIHYAVNGAWESPQLVANVVEYQPSENNALGIHKLVSRIKAEEELWNKVVDEIFNLDSLVKRDKKYKHLSRYVKDVFGVKIVTGSSFEVVKVHEALEALLFSDEDLEKVGVPSQKETQSIEFLEIKNYLGATERKKSGWEALKSVVRWWETVFEIQVQPLSKFMREREFLTRESHSGFKSRREELRDKVAEEIPLFKFFRDLLRWMFIHENELPPPFPGVTVELQE